MRTFATLLLLLLASCATPVTVHVGEQRHSSPVIEVPDPAFAGADTAAGRQAFLARNCNDCHRVEGDPALPIGTRPSAGPLLRDLSRIAPNQLAQRITSGNAGAEKPLSRPTMRECADSITAGQLADVVAYLRNPADAKHSPNRE